MRSLFAGLWLERSRFVEIELGAIALYQSSKISAHFLELKN
ncbi:hypothetical protein APA_1331 [Pseudanabaena sp. lw0831]|nr:hypothetical protein APA_1331 [Pseudanabaena sp. lw0831]